MFAGLENTTVKIDKRVHTNKSVSIGKKDAKK